MPIKYTDNKRTWCGTILLYGMSGKSFESNVFKENGIPFAVDKDGSSELNLALSMVKNLESILNFFKGRTMIWEKDEFN